MSCKYCEEWDAATNDNCPGKLGKMFCTRERGHEGPHVACGVENHEYAIWKERVDESTSGGSD
jgi:hypothetical protein